MTYPRPSPSAMQAARLINADRMKSPWNRPALRLNWQLSYFALKHSQAMAAKGYIWDPTDAELETAVKGMVWKILGANTGETQFGPDQLITLEKAFMQSKPHRQNIENARFTRVGIGFAVAKNVTYETQIFYG